ncbi:mitochondrial inner membrane protein required for protein import [Kappamyces sp. JEL0829]|nr:mitochondrial inner membrane protein required for protein import [Kappamyces sp. JEL0829]
MSLLDQTRPFSSARKDAPGTGDVDGDSAFAQAMRDQKAKEGTDEPASEESQEPQPEGPKKSGSGIGWAVGLGVLASYIYLGQTYESPDVEGENWFEAHNRRSWESIKDSYDYFMNPPTKSLLPPLPPQLAREHTLCFELTDALTHLVWDKDVGWRVAIRPGAKQLLYTLHQYFEIVLFTNTPSHLASPVMDALDNYGLVHYRLFREHHRLDKDTHLKDLSFLNRDLSRVIVVDNHPECLGTHPENGILIKSWQGESGDRELFKYTAFLQELVTFAAAQKIKDLRPLLTNLKELDGQDLPRAWESFKANLRALAKEKEGTHVEVKESLFATISSTVQALVGGGVSTSRPNVTSIDRLEKYCADTRKALDKDLKRHAKSIEEHRHEQEEMIQQQMEEIKNSDFKLIDYLTGNVPQPGQPTEHK